MLWTDDNIKVYNILKTKNKDIENNKNRNLFSIIKKILIHKDEFPKFKMIVCMTKDGLIGDAEPEPGTNGLLWKSKEELKFFKEKTMGNVIVVGYNTAKYMPLSLIRKTRDVEIHSHDMFISDLQDKYKNTNKDIFICGGAKTYQTYLENYDYLSGEHFEEIYVSVLKDHVKVKECHKPLYFPNIKAKGYICVKREEYNDFISYVFKHKSTVKII